MSLKDKKTVMKLTSLRWALLALFALLPSVTSAINITVVNGGQNTAYGVKLCFNSVAAYSTANAMGAGCINGANMNSGASSGPCSPTVRPYMFVAYYTNQSNADSQQNPQYSNMSSDQTGPITFTITPGGTPVNWCLRFCVNNNSSEWRTYGVTYNGAFVSPFSTDSGTYYMVLTPYGGTRPSGCLYFCLPAGTATNGYGVAMLDCSRATTMDNCAPVAMTGVEWANNAQPATNYVSEVPSTTGTFDPSTNTPIQFSALSSNIVDAIKESGQALYDEVRRAHMDAVNAAQRADAKQGTLNSLVTSGNASLTTIAANTGNTKTSVDNVKTSVDNVKTAVDTVNATLGGQSNQSTNIANNTSNMLSRLTANTNLLTQLLATNAAMAYNLGIQTNMLGKQDAANSYSLTSQGYLMNLRDDSLTIKAKATDTANNTWRSYVADEAGTNLLGGIKGVATAGTNLQAQGNQLLQGVTNQLGSLKGAIDGQGTNEFGVKGAVRDFHTDNTNLLTGILNALTNTPGSTNAEIVLESSSTNYAAAQASGNVANALAVTGTEEAIEGMGTSPGFDGGGTPSMAFAFMGEEFDLNPEARFPGAMGYVKAMITLVATLGFCISMGRLFFETSQTYAAAQSGGVANLTVLGNNPLGALLAPVVAAAFIAVWVFVFVGFFTMAGSLLVTLGGLSVPGNPSAIATYLLASTFPVALLLTFAWTRAIAPLVMGKLVIIAASASRFLIGH